MKVKKEKKVIEAKLKDVIDEFLKEFIEEDYSSKFDVSPTDIKNILEKFLLN